jgi:hypothetical protein
VASFGEFQSAQDPDGSECGAHPGLNEAECLAARTLAHQRGVCLSKSPDVQICPTDLADADKVANGIPLDGCTQLNLDLQYVCG